MQRGKDEGNLKNHDRHRCGVLHRKALPVVSNGSMTRMDGNRRGRLVQTPDAPLDRNRAACGTRRKSGPPKPAPTAAHPLAEACCRAVIDPGFHRMQGRRLIRRATSRTTRLSILISRRPASRGSRNSEIVGRQYKVGRSVSAIGGRHGGPRNRTIGLRTGTRRRDFLAVSEDGDGAFRLGRGARRVSDYDVTGVGSRQDGGV